MSHEFKIGDVITGKDGEGLHSDYMPPNKFKIIGIDRGNFLFVTTCRGVRTTWKASEMVLVEHPNTGF